MRQLFCILVLIAFIACQKDEKRIELIDQENLSQTQIDSILEKFRFKYEKPIILDSNDQVLIPISTEFIQKRKSYSKVSYEYNEYPRYWNVLFYNTKSNETRLLTEDKYRISSISTKNNAKEHERKLKSLDGKILYKIGDIDYNKDRKLNQKDPEFLFISEIDGTNLKRISPINEDLIHYEVVPNSNQIILETRRDINKDSLFNKDDVSIWYRTELIDKEWQINEMIDSSFRRKIEHLYFNQWLLKK